MVPLARNQAQLSLGSHAASRYRNARSFSVESSTCCCMSLGTVTPKGLQELGAKSASSTLDCTFFCKFFQEDNPGLLAACESDQVSRIWRNQTRFSAVAVHPVPETPLISQAARHVIESGYDAREIKGENRLVRCKEYCGCVLLQLIRAGSDLVRRASRTVHTQCDPRLRFRVNLRTTQAV